MPYQAPRPCPYPGCPEMAARGGKCKDHRCAARRAFDANRESASRRGYDRDWYKFRAQFLRQNPMCVHCHAEGQLNDANEIHHIVSLADGGDKYDEANLMPLCHACHSRITMKEVLHGQR